jgi:tRNA (uracil-5-)-methyltransferase TRM9
MHDAVIQQLLELNETFYQTFGKAFAVTRQRIQPGIARVLAELPPMGDWLDLGCGGGTVARACASTPGRTGSYLGVDFSPVLLEEARTAVQGLDRAELLLGFVQGDLTSAEWWDSLEEDGAERFDVISAFAVLHHIPDTAARARVIERVHAQLKPGGLFVLSVWQLQNSGKLWGRRVPWERVGLREEQLEEGDVLMDWRFALPGQAEQTGLRYVHVFSEEALIALAGGAGFTVTRTFASDGEGNRLGLYQYWKKL